VPGETVLEVQHPLGADFLGEVSWAFEARGFGRGCLQVNARDQPVISGQQELVAVGHSLEGALIEKAADLVAPLCEAGPLQFVRVVGLADDVAGQIANEGPGAVCISPGGGLVLLHDRGDIDGGLAQTIERTASAHTPERVGNVGVVIPAGQKRQQFGLFHVVQEAGDIGVRELFLFGSD